jgi:uncharacterized Ntn-hydrolase superfamily protein
MTFSIVACDLEGKTWGVAVASKFLAVGAVVPHAQVDVGAVATQSFANTSFGPRGLELMAKGSSAQETLEALLRDDPNKEGRQVGLVDSKGNSATFSGSICFDWAGGVTGQGYAIQGNILSGEKVVFAMEKKFLKLKGDLPSRLYAALLAGDQVGGDRRGRQSAAIYVAKAKSGYGGYNDRWIDLRVDDHVNPLHKLGELIELHSLYFETSPEKDRLSLRGNSLEQMTLILKRTGYLKNNMSYIDAFSKFIGNENFEERAEPSGKWIDKPVMKYLRNKYLL